MQRIRTPQATIVFCAERAEILYFLAISSPSGSSGMLTTGFSTGGAEMKISRNELLGGVASSLVLAALWGVFTLCSNDAYADQGGRTMKVVRIYTGPDNKSHFEDLEIPLKDGGKVGFVSDLSKATGVVFRETAGDYNYDFHTAPRRQYVVNLEGGVEIEVGDGTKRILGAGDILLAEDTTGQGHISRAVAGKPRRSMFITLD
jgi:hypothetical protein